MTFLWAALAFLGFFLCCLCAQHQFVDLPLLFQITLSVSDMKEKSVRETGRWYLLINWAKQHT